MTNASEQDLKCPWEQFRSFFHPFEIKEGTNVEVGRNKAGVGLRDS